MNKTILINGCSYTFGHGLEGENQDPKLWVNNVFPKDYTLTNIAKSGASNEDIYLSTLRSLFAKDYDVVVVVWTAMPRYTFHFGLERWSTSINIFAHSMSEFKLHTDETIDAGKHLIKAMDYCKRYHNDHHDILRLVTYINSLYQLQVVQRSKRLLFMNALCPWDKDYFNFKDIALPTELSDYKKEMLDIHFRNDEDVFYLYNMIKQSYESCGGIRESHWINLYNSLLRNQIDTAGDDKHPGYKSQRLYVDMLTPIISKALSNDLYN